MTRRRSVLQAASLFLAIITFVDAAAQSMNRQNSPMNMEFIEGLVKKFEQGGIASFMNPESLQQLKSLQSQFSRSSRPIRFRKSDSLNPSKRYSDSVYYPSDLMKRNFDEIDNDGFSGFSKRNFDEIDRSSGFPDFGKRNIDEIDRDGFNGFSKRSLYQDANRKRLANYAKRNIDEIDRDGFNGFSKRNIDEIDRSSGFPDFGKRNFDEIDQSGFPDFGKRNVIG